MNITAKILFILIWIVYGIPYIVFMFIFCLVTLANAIIKFYDWYAIFEYDNTFILVTDFPKTIINFTSGKTKNNRN